MYVYLYIYIYIHTYTYTSQAAEQVASGRAAARAQGWPPVGSGGAPGKIMVKVCEAMTQLWHNYGELSVELW